MTIEYSPNDGDREPLAAFAELSKIMLGEGSLNETLGRIAALARDTIPDTDEVSVTLIDRDKPKTVSSPASWRCISTNGSTRAAWARAWTPP